MKKGLFQWSRPGYDGTTVSTGDVINFPISFSSTYCVVCNDWESEESSVKCIAISYLYQNRVKVIANIDQPDIYKINQFNLLAIGKG